MGRKNSSVLEDIFHIAVALPWWAGVALAILVYVLLHSVAETAVVMPTAPGAMGEFAAKSIYVTLAQIMQWVIPFLLLLGAAGSAIQRRKRAGLHAHVASAGQDAIEGMSWQDFERVVGEAFRKRGFSVVETGGGGADGGVDLILSNGSEKYLAQCKQWRATMVGVPIVRELYGVMAAHGATGGFVVTSGRFSPDALAFAKGRNIDLIDGPKLSAMIRGVQRTGVAGTANCQPPRINRMSAPNTAADINSVRAAGLPWSGGSPRKGAMPVKRSLDVPRFRSAGRLALRSDAGVLIELDPLVAGLELG